MTPQERIIVQVLVAVAWVDGEMQQPESGVVDGLFAGFDASDEDQAAIEEWARTPRTLRDVDVSTLSADDRDTLLRNAALLVLSDGVETDRERRLLAQLAQILDLSDAAANEITKSVRGGIAGASREG
jgi:uncharacterized membrane protein YebE (DUF533 family)